MTTGRRKYWAASDNTWKSPGVPSLTSGGRSTLVYGAYEPDAATAGLLSDVADLTEFNSPSTNSWTPTGGVLYENLLIHGKINKPAAGEALFRNCKADGPLSALTTGNDATVNGLVAGSGLLTFEDCEITVRTQSAGRNCALGFGFTFDRCWLHGGEDQVGIYPFPVNGSVTDANVKVRGSILEDCGFTYPDRDHSDGSHCDLIQIQGGRLIEIIGNSLRGTAHYMPGSGLYYPSNPSQNLGDWPIAEDGVNPGSCLIIQRNGSLPAVDGTVKILNNYFRGGKAQLLIKSTANNFVATGNKFSTLQPPCEHINGTLIAGSTIGTFTHNKYWIRADDLDPASNNVVGITSGGVVVNTTNVWLDGPNAGMALSLPRASGIASDA